MKVNAILLKNEQITPDTHLLSFNFGFSKFNPGQFIMLSIPGYGEAVVEDKGGKVKGKHLDLFVNSRDEALRWGVRHQEVYVLELGGQQELNLSESLKPPPNDVELAQGYPQAPKPVKASF